MGMSAALNGVIHHTSIFVIHSLLLPFVLFKQLFVLFSAPELIRLLRVLEIDTLNNGGT